MAKMFSHTLLGTEKIRVLADGAGLDKHIFIVARQSLTAVIWVAKNLNI